MLVDIKGRIEAEVTYAEYQSSNVPPNAEDVQEGYIQLIRTRQLLWHDCIVRMQRSDGRRDHYNARHKTLLEENEEYLQQRVKQIMENRTSEEDVSRIWG